MLGFLINQHLEKVFFNEVKDKSECITELIENIVSVRNDLLIEKVQTDLHFAFKSLDSLGEIRIDESHQIQVGHYNVPSLYAGTANLTVNSILVDDIQASTRAKATVFLHKDNKLIRCTTNLLINGEKARGTYLSSNCEIYKNIINNKPYYGKAFVKGDWCITGYEPIVDKTGKVVGAIALGYEELNPYLEKTLSNIKVGQTGYVYIMNSEGDVLVHPDIKGSNIKDLDFSKKIIKNKDGIIEYRFNGANKFAAYRYFEPWDWYIVATAKSDDLMSSSQTIVYTTLIAGLITILIGSIFAFLLVNKLVQPFNKLKSCMEIASTGDLSVYSDINSTDEIGILSNSFNHMVKENKRLLEEVIKYNQLKTNFFSNISHELRTPINIIFSSTQLIYSYISDQHHAMDAAKLNKHIRIIKQNGYRLLRLVDNSIDITKIDSGFMNLDFKNHNIVDVVENITLSTVEYVESKSRTILFDTDIEEAYIACDAEKIERIMLNLISNAVKFTEHGDNIVVRLQNKDDRVLISVKDTGIGIAENKQHDIFERFKQVESLLNKKQKGSGIGLSLVKSLVEMHDGKISVISQYGEGTEFIIELPIKLVAEDNQPESTDDHSHQMNIEKIEIELSDIYE
ncbi:MAG: Cache 3/Cache 2 fusion domain-containing protein [Clostridia bacterium]|nr:Cache 3/Cache 2 fusion domain-containing protein [Clostridia bacterium]